MATGFAFHSICREHDGPLPGPRTWARASQHGVSVARAAPRGDVALLLHPDAPGTSRAQSAAMSKVQKIMTQPIVRATRPPVPSHAPGLAGHAAQRALDWARLTRAVCVLRRRT